MARERSYRHDIRCRHCGSNWMPKDGHTRGRQVYKCGDCKRKYTADATQPRFPEQVKRQAVQMRIEGTSISAAARVVGVKSETIYSWVKKRSKLWLRWWRSGRCGSGKLGLIRSYRLTRCIYICGR